MSKRVYKKTVWQKIHHFFLKFNMCRCAEPRFEVLNGLLKCNNCCKPVSWQG